MIHRKEKPVYPRKKLNSDYWGTKLVQRSDLLETSLELKKPRFLHGRANRPFHFLPNRHKQMPLNYYLLPRHWVKAQSILEMEVQNDSCAKVPDDPRGSKVREYLCRLSMNLEHTGHVSNLAKTQSLGMWDNYIYLVIRPRVIVAILR